MDIDSIDNKLAGLPVTEAWLGATFGCFAVRFGPYPPEQVGAFLTRLMEEHKGRHPFFFSLQCAPIEDPVPMLLNIASDEAEEGADAPPPLGPFTTGEEARVQQLVAEAIAQAMPAIIERVRDQARRGVPVR